MLTKKPFYATLENGVAQAVLAHNISFSVGYFNSIHHHIYHKKNHI